MLEPYPPGCICSAGWYIKAKSNILGGLLLKSPKPSLILLMLLSQLAYAAWGAHLPGVTSTLPVSKDEKILYLTLDACKGSVDVSLINFLIERKIPTTFFINAQWINKNPEAFMKLAENPLFEIENHGTKHLPASVSGKSIYGFKGTESKEKLIEEIMVNHEKIKKLTGREPRWFRSGCAYYDSEAVKIIKEELNLNIAGFAITLDVGATLPAQEVYERTITAKSGDILLAHVNNPKGGTARGLEKAIPELLARGFVFKTLPKLPQTMENREKDL
ncbi:MAG: polysaccharide deacetylase family protein [Fibromonadales bacterium]|nr:polysaccharide deacetylase family protein [Fibromonadales bacterium]